MNMSKSVVAPVIAFAGLAAMIVVAVLSGNFVFSRTDDCRPFGSPTEDDNGATLLVFSDDDALMLCDVAQEATEYAPPQHDHSRVWVGDSLFRLQLTYDNEMQGGTSAKIEGDDSSRDVYRYPKEGHFSPEGLFRRTPVYVKGEFGNLEDCGFFGESLYMSDYESDDADMFNPDRIQSCWIKVDYTANGG